MLHEILFNATIPGAYVNAMRAAEEQEQRSKRHRRDKLEFDCSDDSPKSRRAAAWARLSSLFHRRARVSAGQAPAE